ncbi:hypothetical protein J3Q64DRAFT_1728964 [Phycomyces blakesleeanus]|uniref:Geranylgeranyl transferase type-2 subunit alpha n=1 Tax=Phycomyces blakesleeanus TaxID=4837 RepID=A0ABR3B4Q9_PHYBL
MSDVHGVKRVRTTEDVIKARREREAGKITEYNALVRQCHEKLEAKEFSPEALTVTTQILYTNPDYYTIWNIRRLILINGILDSTKNPTQTILEKNRTIYMNELGLFMQLIRINPKSYWLWNHRRWCLETMPKPDWNGELKLVVKMLTMDARNFHGWDYRRYVVRQLRALAQAKQDYEEEKQIVRQEYEFTTQKINQSFSNYSAWHQRSKLLPEIVAEMSPEEKNTVARNELELVKAAFYTDPDDQSAWLYYWWLVGRALEMVSFLGVFRLKGSPLLVAGFNDPITLLKEPAVLTKDNKKVSGSWLPLGKSLQSSGSIWIFSPLPNSGEPEKVSLETDSVLPSSSEKSVPPGAWSRKVETVIGCPETLSRVSTFQAKFGSTEKAWKPATTKHYKDSSANNQANWYTLDRVEILKEEIEAVRELIDLEPESKWALQTLAHFLQQLKLRSGSTCADALDDESVDIFNKLSELDTYRRCRYEESRNRILFNRATNSLLHTSSNNEALLKNERIDTLDLRHISLDTIPSLAPLLLVRNVLTESISALDQLPFFERV